MHRARTYLVIVLVDVLIFVEVIVDVPVTTVERVVGALSTVIVIPILRSPPMVTSVFSGQY